MDRPDAGRHRADRQGPRYHREKGRQAGPRPRPHARPEERRDRRAGYRRVQGARMRLPVDAPRLAGQLVGHHPGQYRPGPGPSEIPPRRPLLDRAPAGRFLGSQGPRRRSPGIHRRQGQHRTPRPEDQGPCGQSPGSGRRRADQVRQGRDHAPPEHAGSGTRQIRPESRPPAAGTDRRPPKPCRP